MTTTADRLRSYWGERQFSLDRITAVAARYWQVALVVALMGTAAGLRLWGLGDRAVHHDESIHVLFAWNITQGIEYQHDPVYHGPFQYFGTGAAFVLFGDSDYTSRLLPALFGIALVGLPFLMRRQLGTIGAFAAAALLALSPALLYFSRFARNDIYVAFFTLAMVVAIWRYLEDRRAGWLIAIGPLMALSFAAKEVTFITTAILIIFLNILVAMQLVDQLRAARPMTQLETALAYAVFTPTAWLVVALWPLTGAVRRRFSLNELPSAGPMLIIFGTLAAPQFAPAVQKLPFVGDDGYRVDSEQGLMQGSVLILLIATAYIGLLWNWRIWLLAAALFYLPYVLLFTSFFTNMGGFWSGIWDSMDYWLGQQHVRRGNQPDYYYFMLLPVYEFLPLIFAAGGALFYAFRGQVQQRLISGAALALVVLFSVMPESIPLLGNYHIHAAFIIATGAVLLLSMQTFTKFLLFWTLAILFGLTVAGEKMPWLAVHLALPLALLGAKVLDDVLSAPEGVRGAVDRARATGARTAERLPVPAIATDLWPFAAGASFALLAGLLFIAFGPGSGPSVLAWLLALAALGTIVWCARRVSWLVAGQVAAVALFATMLVFTVRAGALAAFDQGNPDGTPEELLIYAQGSPKLHQIRDQIEEIARTSGRGHDLKVILDNSVNIWPWPWYLREYNNVEYVPFEEDSSFAPEPGSVVLISSVNQGEIEPFADQYHDPIPYTHMWWFPEVYRGLHTGDFLGDVFSGDLLSTWRGFLIDRTVPGATPHADMLAYFPTEFPVTVPKAPVAPGTARTLPETSVTVIGSAGALEGEFSQPADLAIDAEGNLYVADTVNHRVQKIAPDGTAEAFGEPGADPGQFADPRADNPDYAPDGPWGVAVDAEGNIYVADTWNFRMQKFAPDFTPLLQWGGGDLFGPRDVAIDGQGEVLVVDTGNKRIVRYDSEGGLINTYGGPGDGARQFNEPSGISIAANGDIYVADYWNQRIQHFNADFEYIDEISVPSWGSQGVTDRAYLAALDDGRVLATDPANGRIIVFSPSGEEEEAWRLPTQSGLTRPVGITVHDEQVYISDGLNSTVVRVPLADLLPAPAPPDAEP